MPLPPELGSLSAFIDSQIECLAGSSSELRSLALCAAKHVFDWALETEESSKPHLRTLLTTLTETAPPQTRSRAHSRTTHSQSPVHSRQTNINVRKTPIPSLSIESMNTDQLWQQLDLRAARICENLQVLQGEGEDEHLSLEDDDSNNGDEDENEDEDEDGDEEDVPVMDENDDDDESPWEGFSSEEEDCNSTTEGIVDLQEEFSEHDVDDADGMPISMLDDIRRQQGSNSSKSLHSRGHTDLDDGFFDLATFNTETNEVEARAFSKRKRDLLADEDSTEESEADLFGLVDDLETKGKSEALFYSDFFEPPRMPSKSHRSSKVRFDERVSVKRIKAVGKGMPVSSMADEEDSESGAVPIGVRRN